MFKRNIKRSLVPLHFLHIGKTGGTTIIRMFGNQQGKKHVLSTHSHDYTLKDVPAGELAFFFLRHPISRFVSGFNSRQRKGQPTYNVPWNEEEEFGFLKFEGANDLAESLNSADEELRSSAVRAMKGIRHVNTSFKDWLIGADYLKSNSDKLFYIGFQENFDRDVAAFYKKYTAKKFKTEVKQLHQTPANMSKHLSDRAMKNLEDWYKEDIQLYNFCKELALQVN